MSKEIKAIGKQEKEIWGSQSGKSTSENVRREEERAELKEQPSKDKQK